MSRVYQLAVNAADHLMAKERWDAAASILENYLDTHAENPEVLRRLGKVRLRQGRPGIAAQLFEKALSRYRSPADGQNSPLVESD